MHRGGSRGGGEGGRLEAFQSLPLHSLWSFALITVRLFYWALSCCWVPDRVMNCTSCLPYLVSSSPVYRYSADPNTIDRHFGGFFHSEQILILWCIVGRLGMTQFQPCLRKSLGMSVISIRAKFIFFTFSWLSGSERLTLLAKIAVTLLSWRANFLKQWVIPNLSFISRKIDQLRMKCRLNNRSTDWNGEWNRKWSNRRFLECGFISQAVTLCSV